MADRVRTIADVGATHDPERAAGLNSRSVFEFVCRGDAGPRLGQRTLRVPRARLDGQQVVAVVAIENRLGDAGVFREPALKHISVRKILSILVDVGLDDKTIARPVLIHADRGPRLPL